MQLPVPAIKQASGVNKQEQLNAHSEQHEGPYLSPKVVKDALLYTYDLRSVIEWLNQILERRIGRGK